jgi:ElaB/YqjD/DUF883 family membrane-anchored ribosome-binding protein
MNSLKNIEAHLLEPKEQEIILINQKDKVLNLKAVDTEEERKRKRKRVNSMFKEVRVNLNHKEEVVEEVTQTDSENYRDIYEYRNS